MSKLDRILAFISVIEENGFAAAARKKGVSTAAISRQISALEADLGAQLLQRTTRQMALTEIGTEYYAQCKKTLIELHEAELAITASKSEASGVLTITSNRYFAERCLIPRLADFMAMNPQLKIKIELAERFPNLSEERIDILFGVSMESDAELVRRRVALTRYVLCASPDYLKKYGIPITPADLQQHLHITHSMRQPANVIKFKDGKTIYIEPVLALNDSRAMCECAKQGIGIAKLHDYVVADALKKNQLIEILSEFQEQQESVYLYYQQSRYLQPKIRRFIDFFVVDEPKSGRKNDYDRL